MSSSEQSKLIMVIEDSPLDAHILCNVLRDLGYNTVWVESLEDAYECLRGTTVEFDAFIIDFQFKGDNSTKLIVELKTSTEFSVYHNKPLLLVTSINILNLRELHDYKEHLEKLVGGDIINKTADWSQWLRSLLKRLLFKLGDLAPDIDFSKILSGEKIKGYRKSFIPSRGKEIDINFADSGISSIVAIFSEPKTIEQATFEIVANAINLLQTEKEFASLSNTKKAEIIGVHRIKYGRLIKEILRRNKDLDDQDEKSE